MKSVEKAVDADFKRNERKLFSSEGSSGGPTWPPIPKDSPYGKWKQKRYPGRKVMQRKGDLRRSLTQKGGDHVARTFKVGNWKGQWGTKDAKALWHRDAARRRDTLQHTDEQWRGYLDTTRKAMLPHIARAVRVLAAWRG